MSQSLLTLATNKGFLIYHTSNYHSITKETEYDYMGDLKLAIPLFNSELIFLVGKNGNQYIKSNQIFVWNHRLNKNIAILNFRIDIIDLKLTSHILFVILCNKLILFDIKNLKLIKEIKDVYLDMVSISKKIKNKSFIITACYISYNDLNSVKIIRFKTYKTDIISCSENNINIGFRKIQFLYSSHNYIAVSNKKGKKIHLISLNDLRLKYCFWRGKNPVSIVNISFDEKENFMCVITVNPYLI